MNSGLSKKDMKTIIEVFKKYPEVETALLYGSRAMGNYKRGSDIDIALKGNKLTSSICSHIHFELEEETLLPYFFDITDYHCISNDKLKEHIDRVGKVFYRKGWVETTLGEVAKVQTGPFGSQLHNEDYVDIGTPMITVENIVGDKIQHTYNTPKVSDEDKQRLSKYILKEGDIVFSRVGSVDRSAYVSVQEDGWMFSGRLLRVRGDMKKISPHYLHYSLTKRSTKEYIKKIAVGATMPSINTSILSEIPLIITPLPVQKAITRVLSSLDKKIDILQQQNQTLEKIAQTLFKQWFVDFNFPDENGKPYKDNGGEMVESELGEIPKSWYTDVLGNEFEILMGQSPAGKSYNENQEGIVFFQGRTDFGFRHPKVRLYTSEPKRIAERFDVLVSVRAPVGDINVASDKCCIGRGLSAVKSEYKSYCLYKLKSLVAIFKIFEKEGTVFGALNKETFNNINVVVPKEAIKKLFEKIGVNIDQKILNNTIEIQTLTKTRDTLLPKLMSGQIRVNN